MARLEQVIIAEESFGKGEPWSPLRRVTAFYLTDGTPLGHVDPCAPYESLATGEWVFNDKDVKVKIIKTLR